jgi:hypothetical protein
VDTELENMDIGVGSGTVLGICLSYPFIGTLPYQINVGK